MLKTGGVPEKLIEDLIVIQKISFHSKVKKEAKTLLLNNAPSKYMPLINDSRRFQFIEERVSEQRIKSHLNKVAKKTSKEAATQLSIIFYKKLKKGLRFVLHRYLNPCSQRTEALNLLVEDGCLNLRQGLGYRNWKNISAIPDKGTPLKWSIGTGIDALKLHPKTQEIIFHNCKIKILPKEFGNFRALKKIDLSYNFLEKLPLEFSKLENLEYLDLSGNGFFEFPKILARIPNLKFLDLRQNRPEELHLKKLKIPIEVKTALPNCEILV